MTDKIIPLEEARRRKATSEASAVLEGDILEHGDGDLGAEAAQEEVITRL